MLSHLRSASPSLVEPPAPDAPTLVDVAVVGGGAAGLAAATALARSLRSVVVIDAGAPRNAVADGAHNVLGHEGVAPRVLLAAGRREAESYGVRVVDDTVADVRSATNTLSPEITVRLASGATVVARRLILATGLHDVLPDVPGLRDGWGRTVLHCPFCHGWEVRDGRIGVLGSSDRSLHQLDLFRQLSDDVTLVLHELDMPAGAALDALTARDVRIVSARAESVHAVDGGPVTVALSDGSTLVFDALVVAPRFVARADLYTAMGGTVAEHPAGGTYIATGPTGLTNVRGVYAAGNVTDPMSMVVASAGAGVAVGAGVHGDLVAEDVAAAISARRRSPG